MNFSRAHNLIGELFSLIGVCICELKVSLITRLVDIL